MVIIMLSMIMMEVLLMVMLQEQNINVFGNSTVFVNRRKKMFTTLSDTYWLSRRLQWRI